MSIYYFLYICKCMCWHDGYGTKGSNKLEKRAATKPLSTEMWVKERQAEVVARKKTRSNSLIPLPPLAHVLIRRQCPGGRLRDLCWS